jgi:hypothetical protein
MQIRRNQVEIVTISLVECLAASEFKYIIVHLRVVNIVEKRGVIEQMMLRGSPVSHLSKTEVHEHMKTSHVCVIR